MRLAISSHVLLPPPPPPNLFYSCLVIDFNRATLERALLVGGISGRERSSRLEDKHNSEVRLPTTKEQHILDIQVTLFYYSFSFLLSLLKSRLQAAVSKDSQFLSYLFVSKAICTVFFFFTFFPSTGESTSLILAFFLFKFILNTSFSNKR